ncbi:MAG: PAS domain-containing protein [Myxococcales bacterium]|nr:PAS domain-containing protein [Myxococcales bacterium]
MLKVRPEEQVDPHLLQEAFEQFMLTSKAMEKAYGELQAKVEMLNLELEEKNRELSAQLVATERARGQLADVLASLGVAVAVFDEQGRLARLNQSGEELFGIDESQAAGMTMVELFAVRFRDLSGLEVLRNHATLLAETEIGDPDDPTGRVLRVSTHPMRGVGAGEGRILLADDVTETVQRRQAAERNQRLAAMGEMAVQIVHQIRNPMGSIELFASLLKRDLQDLPDKAELAGKVQQGIKSLNLIIGNLLSFAKGADPVIQPVDFQRLMADAVADLDQQFARHGVEVIVDLQPGAEVVYVDPELWRQAMLNLMINAVQAMKSGGVLRIAACRAAAGEAPWWRVAVSDTGPGISVAVRERIFNPFFTTKERGTGLGLALVHNIVKAHNGAIEVDSVEGQGATFTITIPG